MRTKGTNRRHFIRNLALTLIGSHALSKKAFSVTSNVAAINSAETPTIMNYKTLGRTGFKVSDIASGAPKSETVLKLPWANQKSNRYG